MQTHDVDFSTRGTTWNKGLVSAAPSPKTQSDEKTSKQQLEAMTLSMGDLCPALHVLHRRFCESLIEKYGSLSQAVVAAVGGTADAPNSNLCEYEAFVKWCGDSLKDTKTRKQLYAHIGLAYDCLGTLESCYALGEEPPGGSLEGVREVGECVWGQDAEQRHLHDI